MEDDGETDSNEVIEVDIGMLLRLVLVLPDGNVRTVRRCWAGQLAGREGRGTRVFRFERPEDRETLLLGHAFDVHPLIIRPQPPRWAACFVVTEAIDRRSATGHPAPRASARTSETYEPSDTEGDTDNPGQRCDGREKHRW